MKELLLKYSLLNLSEKDEVRIFIDFLLAKRKQKAALSPTRKTLPQVSEWETDDFYTAVRQNDKPLLNW